MRDTLRDPGPAGYALVDAGDGRRLERFGPHVIDRPVPAAFGRRRNANAWPAADLRFDAIVGWTEGGQRRAADSIDAWPVEIEGLTMEVRPTTSGGVGLYPEHAASIAWLERSITERRRLDPDHQPALLNLFAHTGLLTLAAARAGAAVTHVDGARGAVDWARRNAALSGLADRPVRWIVDDAATFVSREGRRERRYDGIVLDPPSFGHARGRQWRLATELPALVAACRAAAADDAFVLLTAHTIGLDTEGVAELLRSAFDAPASRLVGSALVLTAESGARLDLGWSVRLQGR